MNTFYMLENIQKIKLKIYYFPPDIPNLETIALTHEPLAQCHSLQGCPTFGISVPHWKKSCIDIVTRNHKKIS